MLDKLGNPDATTIVTISHNSSGDFEMWIKDRKNRRVIPYRMERCGYIAVRNDAAKDGYWKIKGTRQPVYAKSALSVRDRLKAAAKLTNL